jgi:oxygen-independent coproporphyrinogen-3 oxidase
MAGIYLHIPFCKQACHYCNFHFSTQLGLVDAVLAAMHMELEQRRHELAGQSVETIYFGGGTPSILPVAAIDGLLQAIGRHYTLGNNLEVTLEANPDDLSPQHLADLKLAGINRLSIGIQSFHDADLRFMNRAHNATEALRCVAMAQDRGFADLSIDLIYGTPTMDDEAWAYNLQLALALGVPHLSAYSLTVEPRTALDSFISKGKLPPLDEAAAARQFQQLVQATVGQGYHHYEISNFALPGRYARHNTSYWTGAQYLGIGPAAHSYNGAARRWNVANNARYAKTVPAGETYYEEETLTPTNQYNEYLMTSLRTMWGVDMAAVSQRFGNERRQQLQLQVQPYLSAGQLSLTDNQLLLTNAGKLLADGIISDLFEVDDE